MIYLKPSNQEELKESDILATLYTSLGCFFYSFLWRSWPLTDLGQIFKLHEQRSKKKKKFPQDNSN